MLWGHSQSGLDLGHGVTSGSTVESAGRGYVARGKDECGSSQVPVHLSVGSLGEQNCLQLQYSSLGPGNRVVLGSIIGTEMCGPVIRGTDGCCSSQVLWRMELRLSP